MPHLTSFILMGTDFLGHIPIKRVSSFTKHAANIAFAQSPGIGRKRPSLPGQPPRVGAPVSRRPSHRTGLMDLTSGSSGTSRLPKPNRAQRRRQVCCPNSCKHQRPSHPDRRLTRPRSRNILLGSVRSTTAVHRNGAGKPVIHDRLAAPVVLAARIP
jgi:hypothetical protein